MNFRRLDPEYTGTGKRGLTREVLAMAPCTCATRTQPKVGRKQEADRNKGGRVIDLHAGFRSPGMNQVQIASIQTGLFENCFASKREFVQSGTRFIKSAFAALALALSPDCAGDAPDPPHSSRRPQLGARSRSSRISSASIAYRVVA